MGVRLRRSIWLLLACLALLGGCSGEDGQAGPSAIVLQTLAAEPTIVRPGCVCTVQARVSEHAPGMQVTWSSERGEILEQGPLMATVRAPELEELTRLPDGFTVRLELDAGERGQAVGAIGVVVDRRLGAPCDG